MSRDFSRRSFLAACAAAAGGCSAREAELDTRGRQILTVWHPWGGTRTASIERVFRAFEAAHPNIALRTLFTPNDLSNNQKFFTSVAASKPPDVIFVDGPQVAEWAERGALMPLDGYFRSGGVEESFFFEPCWKQCYYRDKPWAVTFCADPNFAFAWNKADFRSAGLDPERPPTTVDELDAYSQRLAKSSNGKIERIGIIPWNQYGAANSIFTWGWVFGGEFYNPEARKITANHPKVVQALEWIVSYAKRFDVTRVMSLQQGFGTAQLDPFYVGQMAMRCLHIGGVDDIKRYAPELDFGLGFIPAPPDGEQRSSWVGGWCIALPSGSRRPEAGWELIRWLCADKQGTEIVGREMGLMPGMKSSPAFEGLRRLPGLSQYYQILVECRHQRPVMPVQAYYMGALQRAVDAAVYGKKAPQRALDDATAETQAELDVVLRGSA